jgi:acylphosphatase
MSEVAVRVMIRGRVQGVWYRGWTVDQATARGLRGWVRNRRDGSVEAVFVGPSAKVEAMVAACHQGPPTARVTSVERFEADDPGTAGFGQRASE